MALAAHGAYKVCGGLGGWYLQLYKSFNRFLQTNKAVTTNKHKYTHSHNSNTLNLMYWQTEIWIILRAKGGSNLFCNFCTMKIINRDSTWHKNSFQGFVETEQENEDKIVLVQELLSQPNSSQHNSSWSDNVIALSPPHPPTTRNF